MKSESDSCKTRRFPSTFRWALAAVVAFAAPAWAVIPGLTGPIQALIQILPQILPFIVAGIAGALGIPTWRARFQRWMAWMTTARGLGITVAIFAILLAVGRLLHGGNRSQTAVASAAVVAAGSGQGWSMFRGNLTRTGDPEAGPGPSQARVVWSFQDPDTRVADISSSPAVVGGRVFVGSAQASVFDSSGMVYAIDAATGKRIWQFATEKEVFSSPTVVQGKVLVGEGLHVDSGCKLYCLDAATGNRLWATTTHSHTEASPAVVGNHIFTGAGEDGVYCLDLATGKPVWHTPGMHVDASPAVTGGRLYAGTGYGKLRAFSLDAATGKIAWDTPSDLPVWGPPAVVGQRVYFGIGNGDFVKSAANPRGGVWCLDAATGKQVWRHDLPDAVVTSVASAEGKVVVGCRDGSAYALDAAKGTLVWRAPCGGPVVASPALDASHVYIAGGGGKLVAVDIADGKPDWSLDLKPVTAPDVHLFSSPAIANGKLYLGTSKGKLLCLGK